MDMNEVGCTKLDELDSALPSKCSIVLVPLWKEQAVTLTVFNQLCLLTVKGFKMVIVADTDLQTQATDQL